VQIERMTAKRASAGTRLAQFERLQFCSTFFGLIAGWPDVLLRDLPTRVAVAHRCSSATALWVAALGAPISPNVKPAPADGDGEFAREFGSMHAAHSRNSSLAGIGILVIVGTILVARHQPSFSHGE
jgi:hypothetical protein